MIKLSLIKTMFLFSTLAGQALWKKCLLREGKEKCQHYPALGPIHLLEWRKLEQLSVLQKHAFSSTSLCRPYLTSPLTSFQCTVLQTLNLCLWNKDWINEQTYAVSPDRKLSNITVFTTRETFDCTVQVQQWNKHSVDAESCRSG